MTQNYSSIHDNLLVQLANIVHQNLDREDFDVESFAGKAGMSRSELYRKIKKHSGKSVTQFIRDIRLEEGMKLIKETDLTISEISYRVGFNSPTYFNKCFKENFGITPGEADAGKTPTVESLYESTVRDKAFPGSGYWRSGNIWLLFIIVFLSGLGYWYYVSSQTDPASNQDEPREVNTLLPNTNEQMSVAVLPLQNWTGSKDYDFICFGISDAIITKLTDLKIVDRVTPLSSIMPARDSLPDLKILSEQLNVDNVLHGSVQKAGSQIKFSLQFFNLDSNKIYWSKHFIIDWDPEQAFEMQTSIAENIAETLNRNIDSENRGPFNIPTSNTAAYTFYLKGMYEGSKSTREGFELSLDFLEKAIEADPGFTDAYVALSYRWLYNGLIWAYTSKEESKKNALKYIKMAMNNGLEKSEVQRMIRHIQFYYELNVDGRNDSIPELEHINMSPYSQDYAKKVGDFEASELLIREVLRNDPYNAEFLALLAQILYFKGETKNAEQIFDDTFETYKRHLDYLRESAKTYYFLEDYANMQIAVDLFYEQFEERPPVMLWLKAISEDLRGNATARDRILTDLQSRFKAGEPGSPGWYIALYHAYKRDRAKTLNWLEKSYAAREVEMTWLAQEPDLKFIGEHPRYINLLDSMNFPQKSRTHVELLE